MAETLQERYDKRDHNWIMYHCFFCEAELKVQGPSDFFTEEVGEFWSETLQASVLGHPDCLPLGIDAIFEGTDTEWKMA